MFDIRTELPKLLKDTHFHLVYGNVMMSEHNGIGTIMSEFYETRDSIFEYLKTQDVNVFMNECTNTDRWSIHFYSDEYKDEIERTEQVSDGHTRDKETLRHWYWQEVAQRVVIEYLMEKYDAPLGFENEYWYGLDVRSHEPIFLGSFVTRGSEIDQNRHVEFEERIRELADHEKEGALKPDPKLVEAEKELYFWYVSRGDNFSSLLYTLIAKADVSNRTKLRKAYPYEVEAMNRFQNECGYWEEVERRVNNPKLYNTREFIKKD